MRSLFSRVFVARPGLPIVALSVVGLVILVPASGARAAETGGLWDKVLQTLDVKTTPGQMPDFVEATRPDPADLRYLPTGQPHPKRSDKVKTPGEVEAAKQALDAAAAGQLLPRAAPVKPALPAGKGLAKRSPAKPAAAKPGIGDTPGQAGAVPAAAAALPAGD